MDVWPTGYEWWRNLAIAAAIGVGERFQRRVYYGGCASGPARLTAGLRAEKPALLIARGTRTESRCPMVIARKSC